MAALTECKHGDWEIACRPADGGRLERLRYGGIDLLAPRPRQFRAPSGPHVPAAETRPVYGYDDCFPSYHPCVFPGRDWEVPDHGELCWRTWQVETIPNGLRCTVGSDVLPVTFERRLTVAGNVLHWHFAVHNHGQHDLPLLHVMNPRFPLRRVVDIELPAYGMRFDEHAGQNLPPKPAPELARDLLATDHGTCRRLLLRNVKDGVAAIRFREGLRLTCRWQKSIFPTLAVWWNNGAFPEEDGLRRAECSLQPVTGAFSSLAVACTDGKCLFIGPGRSRQWQVTWTADRSGA